MDLPVMATTQPSHVQRSRIAFVMRIHDYTILSMASPTHLARIAMQSALLHSGSNGPMRFLGRYLGEA
ncbi:hypothetical protein [Paracoccus marcusii]|uniref:hypothetical protein n=1 Tax=Paracoccus marcusii TaxID=59779 RepID=UPI0014312656|nr:hypothetical protein [Paracoccus marcusii]